MIDYYTRVAPAVLPHLRDRPLTLKRYPNGVEGQYFYEKQCPSHRPDWVDSAPVRAEREDDRLLPLRTTCRRWCGWRTSPTSSCTPSLSKAPRRRAADDDGRSTSTRARRPALARVLRGGARCCATRSAARPRVLPEDLGLEGMQVYVPLNTPTSTTTTAPSRSRTRWRGTSRRSTRSWSCRARGRSSAKGKVLIDWSQNDEHKTTVVRLLAAGARAARRCRRR